jgi:hypothetical protein
MILPCSPPFAPFQPDAPEGVPTDWNARPELPLGAESCIAYRSEPMGVTDTTLCRRETARQPARTKGQREYSTKESASKSAAATASMRSVRATSCTSAYRVARRVEPLRRPFDAIWPSSSSSCRQEEAREPSCRRAACRRAALGADMAYSFLRLSFICSAICR